MTDATTDSFLDGQGIPVALPGIEAELAKLWGPAAEQVGGPEIENPHVTRIVLANLVVICLDGDCGSLAPVLETVIARFPCRAIVVRGSQDSERRLTADVSALCHLPAPGLPQVCSERILLRTGPNAIDLIPGAVRPLLESDLPMILWWTSDPRKHEHLFRDIADECSRLVLDLPDPGAPADALRLGLDPKLCPCSRDSAWFGLARWRELVAQFFDPTCSLPSLTRISTVTIEALSPDSLHPPRIAIWMAAWLAGQLGWKAHGLPMIQTSGSASTMHARFSGPPGEVAVEIQTRPIPAGVPDSPRVVSLTLATQGDDGAEHFKLTRPATDSSSVRVEIESRDACALPRVVDAPELDRSRRIAAALESSRIDQPFQNAWPIALWLMESAG
jgi:glucose-6-phosphate dehydrogenase assembly protein OpcA